MPGAPRPRLVVRRVPARREPDLRALVLRGDFEADVERFAAGLRAVDARLAPAPADFGRLERFAPDLLAVERFAVERLAVERLAVDRFAAVLRPPELLRDAPELVPALAPPSIVHLPDITR